MKKVKVQDAIGMILCHDMTKIIPGEFKGRAFKKGHIIKQEDILELLSMGKEHIYVWENIEGILHENDAAERIKDLVCGRGLEFGEIKEGKIDFIAKYDGVVKINKDDLFKINSLGEIAVCTIHNNTPVKKGDKVGATRVIPLAIDENKILKAKEVILDKIIKVEPIKPKKVFIITTGSEVYKGRVKDAFGPVLKEKLQYYGCEIIKQVIILDDKDKIIEEIKNAINSKAEMILCTGGMSVDPDDITPTAIKECGGKLVTYGSPVLPGAMFLLSYYNNIPILGLPGCVMYAKRTVFDIVLPRILIDEKLNFKDIAEYGHGGLCLNCPVCAFPNCSFGKGV